MAGPELHRSGRGQIQTGTDRGGGGPPLSENFRYNSSPHLKIFSANGPRLLRSLPPPAPRLLCAWPVSHTPA